MRAGRGLFWPFLLIALGVLFLLANYGYVTGVSWVGVLNLWPFLLILIGLDLAFARRWPVPTLFAQAAVIVAGLVLVATAPSLAGGFVFFRDRGVGVADVSVPREGATSLRLHVNGGAGRYRVSAGATQLVEAHSAGEDLRVRSQGTGRVDVRVDQVGGDGIFRGARSADITLRLASDVPTSFDLNSGAGEFDIDLADVAVTDAQINTGASQLKLVVGRPKGDATYRVNAGASSLTVAVPEGVEARVSTSGAILDVRSENPRLPSSGGGSLETRGYASATDRVTVTITAGASSIVVRSQ
jgi:hypothetical protein